MELRVSLAAVPMRILVLVLSLVAFAIPARAQTNYPDRTVRILIGFPPSAAPDVAARLLGERLSKAWGVPVIVENVVGASGNIATERVARAAPDGYTLLMAGSAAIVINVSLFPNLPFDLFRDLTPISQVLLTPNILVVPIDVPAKSLSELIALARAQPGQLTFGSAGFGTSQHLGGELLKSMAGIDIRHIPYRGGPAVMPDLLGGRLTMAFANISNALPLIREGKLRALAITSQKRSPSAPDIPTMAELGYPDFDANVWFGLMAPAGTPTPVIRKIHTELLRALEMKDVQKVFFDLGMISIGNTPEEFLAVIKAEIPRWEKIVKSSGAEAVGGR